MRNRLMIATAARFCWPPSSPRAGAAEARGRFRRPPPARPWVGLDSISGSAGSVDRRRGPLRALPRPAERRRTSTSISPRRPTSISSRRRRPTSATGTATTRSSYAQRRVKVRLLVRPAAAQLRLQHDDALVGCDERQRGDRSRSIRPPGWRCRTSRLQRRRSHQRGAAGHRVDLPRPRRRRSTSSRGATRSTAGLGDRLHEEPRSRDRRSRATRAPATCRSARRFAFNNAAEVPLPARRPDQRVRTSASTGQRSKGMFRLGYEGSWYNEPVPSLVWDNPMRVTD